MTYQRSIHVSEVMISDLHTIDGLATVSDAVAIMQEHSISSLVVNARNEDDEAGTDRRGRHCARGDREESLAGPCTCL